MALCIGNIAGIAQPLEYILYNCVSVDGIADCLPDADIAQVLILIVHCQLGEAEVGDFNNGEAALLLCHFVINDGQCSGAANKADISLACDKRTEDVGRGYDLDHHLIKVNLTSIIIFVGHQLHTLAGNLALVNQLAGAGHVFKEIVVLQIGRSNILQHMLRQDVKHTQIGQEGKRIRCPFQREPYRKIIQLLEAKFFTLNSFAAGIIGSDHRLQIAVPRGCQSRIHVQLKCEHHIIGGQLLPVAEVRILTDMNGVFCHIVIHFVAFGDHRNNITVHVIQKQRLPN